jgi:hypothetical protein
LKQLGEAGADAAVVIISGHGYQARRF